MLSEEIDPCGQNAIWYNTIQWQSTGEDFGKMAEQIKIALASFGRGMVSFVRPFDAPIEITPQEDTGIGKYFARVGVHLANAQQRFAEEHPEVLQNAD